MVRGTKVSGRIWARCLGAWRRMWGSMEGTAGGEGGSPEDASGYAETKRRLKAALRESNFKPPSVATQRQRAAAILCERIDRRGAATVSREMQKVGNR
jgi:hypothetical protein